MKKATIEEQIIDYLNGEYNGDIKVLEQKIATDPEVAMILDQYRDINTSIEQIPDVFPPSPIRHEFEAYMNEEYERISRKQQMNPKLGFILLTLIALFAVSFSIYLYIQKSKASPLENYAYNESSSQEHEMIELLNASAVTNRIKAVNMSSYMDASDDDIIRALSKTLLTDESDHVRLVAVTALGKFSEEKGVRSTLLAAIDKEKDESVLIALINLLSAIKEKEAVQSFDKIINDNTTLRFVKDEAFSAKIKLSDSY